MDFEERDQPKSFERLGELVRSLGTGHVPRAVDALGEHRVTEAFEKNRRGSAMGRIAAFGAVVAMAVAAIAISGGRFSRAEVSWTVDGTASRDAAYISSAPDKEAMVRFSDGSELEVQPGSRLRIAEAGRKAVKAVMESGATRVRIAGRSSIGWTIDAGPFSVSPGSVASLMIEWLADELLRVSVFEGDTSVVGTPSPLVLHAGQRLSASARDGTVQVVPLATAPAMIPSAVPEMTEGSPQAPSPSGEPGALGFALPAPAAARRPSWSDAVIGGDYAGVLLDAERRGISQVLAQGSMADVVALGDAARLMGRLDLARRALLAERSRFSRSGAAKDAAFFLGRLADDHEHAPGSALPWYETYLSEAPDGHFAAEAFGRKMIAISKQSGRAAAKPVALEYLKRFPAGPHAAAARELASD
jgi:hypothetical protein